MSRVNSCSRAAKGSSCLMGVKSQQLRGEGSTSISRQRFQDSRSTRSGLGPRNCPVSTKRFHWSYCGRCLGERSVISCRTERTLRFSSPYPSASSCISKSSPFLCRVYTLPPELPFPDGLGSCLGCPTPGKCPIREHLSKGETAATKVSSVLCSTLACIVPIPNRFLGESRG